MKPILPRDVHAPRNRWVLIDVVHDGGPGAVAIAIGRWDGREVLAMRWTGDESNALGNPHSRGRPTWFILPEGKFTDAIIAELQPDKRSLARALVKSRR